MKVEARSTKTVEQAKEQLTKQIFQDYLDKEVPALIEKTDVSK